MDTTIFLTHRVMAVALHESINVNLNTFNDIANRISTQRESRFSRRLARNSRQVLGKVCSVTSFVSNIRRIMLMRHNKAIAKAITTETVLCMGLDDTLNTSENVFRDIARAIYQRSISDYCEEERTDDIKKTKDVIKNSTKRCFGFFRAVKRLFTCSASGASVEKVDGWRALYSINRRHSLIRSHNLTISGCDIC